MQKRSRLSRSWRLLWMIGIVRIAIVFRRQLSRTQFNNYNGLSRTILVRVSEQNKRSNQENSVKTHPSFIQGMFSVDLDDG